MSRRAAILILVTMLLIGCDPYERITITVRDVHGRPASDVAIELACPRSRPWNVATTDLVGVTDAHGRFTTERVGETPLDCIVQAQGDQASGVQVANVCSKRRPFFGSCLDLKAGLTLNKTVQ